MLAKFYASQEIEHKQQWYALLIDAIYTTDSQIELNGNIFWKHPEELFNYIRSRYTIYEMRGKLESQYPRTEIHCYTCMHKMLLVFIFSPGT